MKMKMDRFSSRESVPWAKKYFRAGARARRRGLTFQANPWPSGTQACASWTAGWADEDQTISVNQPGTES